MGAADDPRRELAGDEGRPRQDGAAGDEARLRGDGAPVPAAVPGGAGPAGSGVGAAVGAVVGAVDAGDITGAVNNTAGSATRAIIDVTSVSTGSIDAGSVDDITITTTVAFTGFVGTDGTSTSTSVSARNAAATPR